MTAALQAFLSDHCIQGPLLLALSGGPDSMALYHMLQQTQIPFAVAHVNHNWRAESAAEAEFLRNYVTVPFHLHTLNPNTHSGNLEDGCRRERLAFFRSLMAEQGYQAVLMGHHADDQAETVLKRLFEGAYLSALGAMKPSATIDDVRIFRPLLKVRKGALLDYCHQHELPYFKDQTNEDERFLRAKMRRTLIPQLSATFGKEIAQPLEHLAEEAHELESYLEKKVATLLAQGQLGPFGWMLEVPLETPPVELRFLLRKLLPARQHVQTALNLLMSGAANKQVGPLWIDRRRLFFTHTLEIPSEPLRLKEGVHTWGPYHITVERTMTPTKPTGWKALWHGESVHTLPEGSYTLCKMKNKYYPGSSPISEWWNKAKIPVCLRGQVPVIQSGEAIVHEYLTGKQAATDLGADQYLKITLKATCCADIPNLLRELYNVTVEGETVMC